MRDGTQVGRASVALAALGAMVGLPSSPAPATTVQSDEAARAEELTPPTDADLAEAKVCVITVSSAGSSEDCFDSATQARRGMPRLSGPAFYGLDRLPDPDVLYEFNSGADLCQGTGTWNLSGTSANNSIDWMARGVCQGFKAYDGYRSGDTWGPHGLTTRPTWTEMDAFRNRMTSGEWAQWP